MFRSAALTLMLSLTAIGAEGALLGRAPITPGGTDYQAYYDDVLDITWSADARLAATNSFGVDPGFILSGTGTMNHATAVAWIGGMNQANYLGASNWRLPKVGPVNGVSFVYQNPNGQTYEGYDGTVDTGWNIGAPGTAYAGSTASELGHLFYVTLGNNGQCNAASTSFCQPQNPYGVTNAGPFSNLSSLPTGESVNAMTETPYEAQPVAWFIFYMGSGLQTSVTPGELQNAWAVHDGDIGVVPIPGAAWLLGSALGLMGWMRRMMT